VFKSIYFGEVDNSVYYFLISSLFLTGVTSFANSLLIMVSFYLLYASITFDSLKFNFYLLYAVKSSTLWVEPEFSGDGETCGSTKLCVPYIEDFFS
jgi:hypothetical protein